MTGEETARLCAKYADDKKAEDIVILDVRGLSPITDYFVICTASAAPHLRAIHNEIQQQMELEHGQEVRWRDRNYESEWLVLDFTDVMVHIFQREKREFYALEELWGDAKRVPLEAPKPVAAAEAPKKKAARKAAKKATTKKAAKKASKKKASSEE